MELTKLSTAYYALELTMLSVLSAIFTRDMERNGLHKKSKDKAAGVARGNHIELVDAHEVYVIMSFGIS